MPTERARSEFAQEIEDIDAGLQRLAIVKEVGFGNRDVGQPCLWFTVYIDEVQAALQVFVGEDALKKVKESKCRDVRDLEGKPCWVMVDASRIVFVRWFQP